MGIFDKLKKKNKSRKNNDRDQRVQKSLEERYGINSDVIRNNPLYQDEHTQEDEGVEQYNPLYIAEEPEEVNASEEAPLTPKENLLKNIGGMPTRESIIDMAGGLKLEKLGKHKHFDAALKALDEYQEIMKAPQTTKVNEAKVRRNLSGITRFSGVDTHAEAVAAAYEKMVEFAYQADQAVKESDGFFAGRSSNVRKLTPVFSNLLVQAYGLLPKLIHLESAVAPYIIATGREEYTFSDILSHQVTAGRSGGFAMSGLESDNGAVILNPEETARAVESVRSGIDPGALQSLKRDQTVKARMGMTIPELPDKVLENGKKGGYGQDVKAFVDKYIAELRVLMTALDDAAESYEFSSEVEREGVHDQQAEHFRMSRMLYQVIRNRDTLERGILRGFENPDVKNMPGYQEIEGLKKLGGKTLLDASAMLNQQAQDESTYAGLTDERGNQLRAKGDYIVGGGQASISILDFKNQRVLRAPKKDTGEYLSEREQQTALNGIRDEATGKVAQFLGFNVAAQARAVGFKARDEEGNNEKAVFGGSIMDMAKGTEAKNVNLMMRAGDEEKLAGDRRGKKSQNLDIMKQGRLIGDIMKMNVLDYIIKHNDRNEGNFLINLDADERESMVTAIDNDMVLGYDNGGVGTFGGRRSADALNSINDRLAGDFGIKVSAAFPMMTQEVKDALQNLDLDALNQMLMPYADRITRITAVHRAAELVDWAKKVPTCDLTTQEGTEEFVKAAARATMTEWVRQLSLTKTGDALRTVPNTVIRMILFAYGTNGDSSWGNAQSVIEAMKVLGLSKAEAEEIFLNHLSASKNGDEKITMEQLRKSEFGTALENYDQ